MNSFYSDEEIKMMGFISIGNNVLISKKASIYSPDTIEIGNNVRIDDFCLLSGNIHINDYVQICAYSALYAGNIGIEMQEYSAIAPRVTIFAMCDDYYGNSLSSAVIPDKYRTVTYGKVIFEKYSLVGMDSCIMPGCIIKEGAKVGAMSLVRENLEPWSLYAGIPCKKIKELSHNEKDVAKKLERENLRSKG